MGRRATHGVYQSGAGAIGGIATPSHDGELLSMSVVGTSVARKDGIGKATGKALYADDLVFPGMLFGRTIRSTIARGILKSARVRGDVAGLTVVDHRDVPGRNVCYLIEQ